jgi:hypothetical protein
VTKQYAGACDRRAFLKLGAAALLTPLAAESAFARSGDALIGAIRWDAWYAPDSRETKAVEEALKPEAYHRRIPFFGKIEADGEVIIDGGRQEIMDREIEFAVAAGLDFWAFDAYEQDSPLSIAFHLYLASKQAKKPKFCMLVGALGFATADELSSRTRWHVALMKSRDYLRPQGLRPIYILLNVDMPTLHRRWGGLDKFNARLAEFRNLAQREAGANPYILCCQSGGPPPAWMKSLNVDGLTSYAIGGAVGHEPFRDLAARAEAHWNEMAQAGFNVAPTVMTGWDRRPRIEHPMFWEKWQRPGQGMEKYFNRPTKAELTSEIESALHWVRRHTPPSDPRIVLIYAWNENDEGGWLIPTLSGGDARLEAVHKAIEEAN